MSWLHLQLTETFQWEASPAVRYLGSLIPGTENPPIGNGMSHFTRLLWGSPHDSPLSFFLPFPPPLPLLPPTPPPSTNPPSLLHSVKDMPCSEDVACHTPTLAGGGGGDNDTVFSSSPTTDGMWGNRAFLCVSMSMLVYNYTVYMCMDVLFMYVWRK